MGPSMHLYSRHSEVRDLKFDCYGWFSLHLIVLHTGEPKVGSHQELFSTLQANTLFRQKEMNRLNIQENVLLL